MPTGRGSLEGLYPAGPANCWRSIPRALNALTLTSLFSQFGRRNSCGFPLGLILRRGRGFAQREPKRKQRIAFGISNPRNFHEGHQTQLPGSHEQFAQCRLLLYQRGRPSRLLRGRAVPYRFRSSERPGACRVCHANDPNELHYLCCWWVSLSFRVAAALRADLLRSAAVRPVLGRLPNSLQSDSDMSTP